MRARLILQIAIQNLIIRAICLWLLLIAGPTCADTSLRFYYFNPDSPQNNLVRLKNDMQNLLDGLGFSVEFQPFARLTDFDRGLRKDRPSFVFVPGWYLHRYGEELKLRPMLQSVRDNRRSYRKLLIASRRFFNGARIPPRASLAMTSLGPDSADILNGILSSDEILDTGNLNIVEVPKDADAIFAVALGQVDVALVSQASLKRLRAKNPRLIDSLKVLGESEPLAMPVLVVLEGAVATDRRNQFKRFMISTQDSPVMETLRIDGWSVHND